MTDLLDLRLLEIRGGRAALRPPSPESSSLVSALNARQIRLGAIDEMLGRAEMELQEAESGKRNLEVRPCVVCREPRQSSRPTR